MCGIIGYVGQQEVVPVVLDGLRRLEYRGYDSAGIAVVGPDGIDVRRSAGKLANLEAVLRERPLTGAYGIGHTRWATHGRPTEENAHPHRDQSGRVVLVHNGIIENYLELKKRAPGPRHHVPHRDRHRGRGAPGRPGAGRRWPARGGDARAAAAARPVRAGRHLDHRSRARSSPCATDRRWSSGSATASTSSPPTSRRSSPTPATWCSSRTARWPCCAPTACAFFDAAGQSVTRAAAAHHVGPGDGGEGRLQALHAQGDLRAAVGDQGDARRPAVDGAGRRPPAGDQPRLGDAGRPVARRAAGVRHVVACGAGGEVPHRAAGAHAGRGRLRLRVPLPAADRLVVRSRGGHHAVGRDGRHAGGAARGPAAGRPQPRHLQRRRQHGDARSRKARSRRTPARRLASPRPRRSRRSWWRWCCWRCDWRGRAGR